MTRKDFEAIAAALSNSKPFAVNEGRNFRAKYAQWESTCAVMADMCRNQNARFDRERFLKACGAV